MLLVGVSCVCGRTSSFPAGERNQRLPGAGEDSMRRAGPRPPLMQAACDGGASQGRPGRGSLRFRTNGPVENVPFSTTGLCLGEGRCGGEGVLRTWRSFYTWSAYKKPPLKGEVPAKRAEGFRPPRRKVAAALSAAVTTTEFIGERPHSQAEPS